MSTSGVMYKVVMCYKYSGFSFTLLFIVVSIYICMCVVYVVYVRTASPSWFLSVFTRHSSCFPLSVLARYRLRASYLGGGAGVVGV